MSKINWKLRLQNKTTLFALVADIVYILFSIVDIVQSFPNITPDQLISVGNLVIGVLVLLGIVVDPTTDGISDSDRAMDYTAPRKDIRVD